MRSVMRSAMGLTIVMAGALICASCGGGSSSGSAADSAASASAMPSTTASAQSAGSSSPSTSAPAPSSPAPTSPAGPFYKLVEIPRLAATGSVTATAVNDQGVVVGQQETTAAGRAWIYQQSSGALDELSLDPSENGAYANGISDSPGPPCSTSSMGL